MIDPLTGADLDALRMACTANAQRIARVEAFLVGADSHRVDDDLSPEDLLALADDLDDPNLLARPALLRWNTIMRERQGLRR